MPRAGSLTRLNCAEFRDDAWVEMDSLMAAPSTLRHPEDPRLHQRGEGSRAE